MSQETITHEKTDVRGGTGAPTPARLRTERRLLTVDEVASWLQVKPRTVYQWAHEGYIPIIKLGVLLRFEPDAVAAWVRSRAVPGRSRRAVEFDVN